MEEIKNVQKKKGAAIGFLKIIFILLKINALLSLLEKKKKNCLLSRKGRIAKKVRIAYIHRRSAADIYVDIIEISKKKVNIEPLRSQKKSNTSLFTSTT